MLKPSRDSRSLEFLRKAIPSHSVLLLLLGEMQHDGQFGAAAMTECLEY